MISFLLLMLTSGVYLVAALIGVGIALACYVLMSLGLYTLCTRLEEECGYVIEYRWLSWIPIGQYWILGKIIEYLDDKKQLPYSLVFLAGGVIITLFQGSWVSAVELVMCGFAGYMMSGWFHNRDQILMTVLCAFFLPFYIFAVRNKPLPDDMHTDWRG